MIAVMSPSTRAVGLWSAAWAAVCAITYDIGQIAEWLGWMGSVYAVLISINYFVQLTWVAPRLSSGRMAGMEQFLFVPFDSFLYAVDILGYSFMSVATLCAAAVFTGSGIERTARWFLICNGLLLPFIALQMYWHSLIWIAALWAVTFPGAASSVALVFRNARTDTANKVLAFAAA